MTHEHEISDTLLSDTLLSDDRDSWPHEREFLLDGFAYKRIGLGPGEASERLGWLELQPAGFRPQNYQEVARVLRDEGKDTGRTACLA